MTDYEDFGGLSIKVIGVGGGGNNTINRLYKSGIDGAELIAINTDRLHLDVIKADKKVQIGKSLTRGLGAGAFPEIGKRAAELARSTLQELLKDSDLVFITAGLGGGTGMGAAPVVAEIAKEQGAVVIVLVSTPVLFERMHGIRFEEGLAELQAVADSVIVVDCDILCKHFTSLPLEQAYAVLDQLFAETIKAIVNIIVGPSLIRLDFDDVRTIVRSGKGIGALMVGESSGQNRYEDAVKTVVSHPLSGADYNKASGAMVLVTGGPDLELRKVESVVESITAGLDRRATVMWSATISKEYEDRIRVIAIMTGISDSASAGQK